MRTACLRFGPYHRKNRFELIGPGCPKANLIDVSLRPPSVTYTQTTRGESDSRDRLAHLAFFGRELYVNAWDSRSSGRALHECPPSIGWPVSLGREVTVMTGLNCKWQFFAVIIHSRVRCN